MQRKRLWLILCFPVILGAQIAAATPIELINDGLSSATNWTVVGTADTAHTFGYDYSTDGIPAAPGASDTVGLKMEANLTTGAAHEIAATRDLSAAGYISGMPYTVEVDIWTNYAFGGDGSTEFAGAFVGHDATTAGRNGGGLLYTGDGGSSRDYRLYKNDGEQFIASGQYNAGFASNNGSEPLIAAAFPGGLSAPAAQGQTGSTSGGTGGFQWMSLLIEVDPLAIGSGITSDPGLASFTLTSAASGNSLLIGTIDNSNGGTVVDMEGAVALVYADLFTSVADAPSLQFGLYDNLVVTMVPEPATLTLGLAAAGLLFRRR